MSDDYGKAKSVHGGYGKAQLGVAALTFVIVTATSASNVNFAPKKDSSTAHSYFGRAHEDIDDSEHGSEYRKTVTYLFYFALFVTAFNLPSIVFNKRVRTFSMMALAPSFLCAFIKKRRKLKSRDEDRDIQKYDTVDEVGLEEMAQAVYFLNQSCEDKLANMEHLERKNEVLSESLSQAYKTRRQLQTSLYCACQVQLDACDGPTGEEMDIIVDNTAALAASTSHASYRSGPPEYAISLWPIVCVFLCIIVTRRIWTSLYSDAIKHALSDYQYVPTFQTPHLNTCQSATTRRESRHSPWQDARRDPSAVRLTQTSSEEEDGYEEGWQMEGFDEGVIRNTHSSLLQSKLLRYIQQNNDVRSEIAGDLLSRGESVPERPPEIDSRLWSTSGRRRAASLRQKGHLTSRENYKRVTTRPDTIVRDILNDTKSYFDVDDIQPDVAQQRNVDTWQSTPAEMLLTNGVTNTAADAKLNPVTSHLMTPRRVSIDDASSEVLIPRKVSLVPSGIASPATSRHRISRSESRQRMSRSGLSQRLSQLPTLRESPELTPRPSLRTTTPPSHHASPKLSPRTSINPTSFTARKMSPYTSHNISSSNARKMSPYVSRNVMSHMSRTISPGDMSPALSRLIASGPIRALRENEMASSNREDYYNHVVRGTPPNSRRYLGKQPHTYQPISDSTRRRQEDLKNSSCPKSGTYGEYTHLYTPTQTA